MTLHLSVKTIGDLEPVPGAQYVAWDDDQPGLGVRVSPAGAKAYVFKYRLASGRIRWVSLGRVGAVTLDAARKAAKVAAGQVAGGLDPQTAKDDAKKAEAFGEVADRFLEDHVASLKPSSRRSYTQIVDGLLRPQLAAMPIGEIGTDDCHRLRRRLKATPIQANRAMAVLSSLLSWASSQKYRTGSNPCAEMPKYPEHERRVYLTEGEYGRLGQALRDSPLAPGVRLALELLLLTGARPSEIAGLRWDAVKLKEARLELADSKTGRKSIALPPRAVRLLRQWPRIGTGGFVFPGTGRRVEGKHLHPSTLTHAWPELRKAAGISEGVRLYDAVRHSYASLAISRHGMTLAQVGAQLGHVEPRTTARYAHLHDDAARENAAIVGGSIARAMGRKGAR